MALENEPVGARSSPEEAGSEKAIEYAQKLNELALSLSTAILTSMSIWVMNYHGTPPKWVSTALLLFFSSFTCSLAGVQLRPLLKESCVYVGRAALFAFFSGVSVTAIAVLPETHSSLAAAVASVYVGILTFLILREGPWRRPFPRVEQEGTAAGGAAAATPPGNTPAAAAAAAVTNSPLSRIRAWLIHWAELCGLPSGDGRVKEVSGRVKEVSKQGLENSAATV